MTSSLSFALDCKIFGRVVDTDFYVFRGIFWSNMILRSLQLVFSSVLDLAESFCKICASIICFSVDNFSTHFFTKTAIYQSTETFCAEKSLLNKICFILSFSDFEPKNPYFDKWNICWFVETAFHVSKRKSWEKKNSKIVHCFYHFPTF